MVDNEGGEDLAWFDHNEEGLRTSRGHKKVQDKIDSADILVSHNSKHDLAVLRGFSFNIENKLIHCTMLSEYLLRGQDKEKQWSLNAVAEFYGLEQKRNTVKDCYWDVGIDTYDIPSHILGPYCLQDCRLTLEIYNKQKAQMEGRQIKKLIDMQNEFLLVLLDMEINGLKLDTNIAENIIEKYSAKAEACANKIKEIVGEPRFNVSSSSQLSAVLYGGKLKLKWDEWVIKEYKTKSYSRYYEKSMEEVIDYAGLGFRPSPRNIRKDGYFKTDKKTIEALPANTRKKRDFKKLIINYSEYDTVVKSLRGKNSKTGLLTKIQPDGLIHARLNQTIAATGRLTSSDPNGQNLPRSGTSPIKQCFVPTLDGIMQVDLSQMEWRAAAFLSQDEIMINEVNSGVDQHIATVKELMKMKYTNKEDPESKLNRFHAKVFNFRMIFGGTEYGFYVDVNMPDFTLPEWKEIINNFFIKYLGLQDYHNDSIKFVMRHGYLELPTGRWFKFHKTVWKEGVKTYKINQIKNWPVQGISGGDILPLMAVVIKRGMQKMGMRSKIILTVHDSIIFDYAEEEKDKLARLLYNVGNNLSHYIKAYFGIDWNVKLECEVEVGPNYGELKYLSPKEVGL